MKKYLFTLFLLLLSFSFAGCDNTQSVGVNQSLLNEKTRTFELTNGSKIYTQLDKNVKSNLNLVEENSETALSENIDKYTDQNGMQFSYGHSSGKLLSFYIIKDDSAQKKISKQKAKEIADKLLTDDFGMDLSRFTYNSIEYLHSSYYEVFYCIQKFGYYTNDYVSIEVSKSGEIQTFHGAQRGISDQITYIPDIDKAEIKRNILEQAKKSRPNEKSYKISTSGKTDTYKTVSINKDGKLYMSFLVVFEDKIGGKCGETFTYYLT